MGMLPPTTAEIPLAASVLVASNARTKLPDESRQMTLPWDLEDWLTEVGGQVVEKQAALGDSSLSKQDQLILAIWLLDTEARNGGLSQYFANHGVEQWEKCVALFLGCDSQLRTLRGSRDCDAQRKS